MSRRLVNESIRDEWGDLGIVHDIEDNTIYIPVNDMYTQEENILTVICSPTYPFRSPSITYNGDDIMLFYRDLSQTLNQTMYNDLFKLLSGKCCMCCESLLCGNNWNVQTTIKNILEEFEKFVKIKQRCNERFWSRRISSRHLVEDIPLCDYL